MTYPEVLNSEGRRLLKVFALSSRNALLKILNGSPASLTQGEAALNSKEYADAENTAYSVFILSVFSKYLISNGLAELEDTGESILTLIKGYESLVPLALRGCFSYFISEANRFDADIFNNKVFGEFLKILNDLDSRYWIENPEIIGILHQYFHAEAKDRAINAYKGRIEKEQIYAATQLFTPAWVVKYLAENSLGKLWAKIKPSSPALKGFKYFVPSADEENENTVFTNEEIIEKLKSVSFLDPCAGSGNILMYTLELFVMLYTECGLSTLSACENALKHNLFGMDIDERMRAVAAFSLLAKAAVFDKEILSLPVSVNFVILKGSGGLELSSSLIEALGEDLAAKTQKLIDEFALCDEAGCLINPSGCADFADELSGVLISDKLSEPDKMTLNRLIALSKQAAALKRKYSVVVTNPPYSNKPSKRLKAYLLKEYKAYAGDLFSAVMKRCFEFCDKDGYCAFLTPYVWLFIANHKALRKEIINGKSLESLLLFEYSAFADATVPLCAFAIKNQNENKKSIFIGLDEFRGGMDVQEKYMLSSLKEADCPYKYIRDTKTFLDLPNYSFAFWAEPPLIEAFKNHKRIVDIAAPRQGLATGDNSRYVRFWHEVSFEDIGQGFGSLNEFLKSGKKYMPYNKGGSFVRWYGNLDRVLRIDRPYFEELQNRGNRLPSRQLYGKECISWSKVTSSDFSMRYIPKGFAFDVAGCSVFADSELWCLLAFSNSSTMQALLNVLSKTLNYEVGAVKSIPYAELPAERKAEAERLAKESVAALKDEWDRYEQSRDFKCNPLVKIAKEKRNS